MRDPIEAKLRIMHGWLLTILLCSFTTTVVQLANGARGWIAAINVGATVFILCLVAKEQLSWRKHRQEIREFEKFYNHEMAKLTRAKT